MRQNIQLVFSLQLFTILEFNLFVYAERQDLQLIESTVRNEDETNHIKRQIINSSIVIALLVRFQNHIIMSSFNKLKTFQTAASPPLSTKRLFNETDDSGMNYYDYGENQPHHHRDYEHDEIDEYDEKSKLIRSTPNNRRQPFETQQSIQSSPLIKDNEWNEDSSEYFYNQGTFPNRTSLPLRTTLTAFFLLLVGIMFLSIATYKYYFKHSWSEISPFLIIATIGIIPGGYHSFVIVSVWLGRPGYSYDMVPTYDD